MELKFFKQRQDSFVTHANNLLTLLLAILLLGWSISVFIRGYVLDFSSINTIVRTLAPLWVLLSLYWLGIAIVRISVIPARHEMIKEYLFGLYKRRFTLSIPLEVSVSTHYKNGKRVGTDVQVKTPVKVVKVRAFPNSRQIEPFINEFKSLFGGIRAQ